MIITLHNDFHDTSRRVRLPDGRVQLSEAQCRRIERDLCGVAGCMCSGVLGMRGTQSVIITETVQGGELVMEVTR